jgi:hypothetical protein
MMQTIIKEKRTIPYNRCVDPRVKKFSNMTYIKKVCYEMFGVVAESSCEKKESFCKKCCRHHIGVREEMTYENCFLRCENLVRNGVDKI